MRFYSTKFLGDVKPGIYFSEAIVSARGVLPWVGNRCQLPGAAGTRGYVPLRGDLNGSSQTADNALPECEVSLALDCSAVGLCERPPDTSGFS